MVGTNGRRPLSALALSALAAVSFCATASAGSSTQLLYQKGPITIPDGQSRAAMTFVVTSAPAGQTVFDPKPNFRVRHPRTSDLKLSIRGPNGATRTMSNGDTKGNHLGSGQCQADYDDSVGYTGFSAESTSSLADDSAPYAGYFEPRRSLSPLIGIEPEGTWKVIVEDDRDGKRGKLLCGLIVLELKTP